MPIGAQWQAKNVDGEKQKRGNTRPGSIFCRSHSQRYLEILPPARNEESEAETPRRESKKQSTACIPPANKPPLFIAFMERVYCSVFVCSEVWDPKAVCRAN